ncbi:hypothetical protein [Streptomyces sp. YGL11-2]
MEGPLIRMENFLIHTENSLIRMESFLVHVDSAPNYADIRGHRWK